MCWNYCAPCRDRAAAKRSCFLETLDTLEELPRRKDREQTQTVEGGKKMNPPQTSRPNFTRGLESSGEFNFHLYQGNNLSSLTAGEPIRRRFWMLVTERGWVAFSRPNTNRWLGCGLKAKKSLNLYKLRSWSCPKQEYDDPGCLVAYRAPGSGLIGERCWQYKQCPVVEQSWVADRACVCVCVFVSINLPHNRSV